MMKFQRYEDILKKIQTAYTKAQYTIDLKFPGLRANVDEIAILLTEEDLDDFLEWCEVMDDTMDHMGSSLDTMKRLDKPQSFSVRFEFFQPSVSGPTGRTRKRPYRIEAMAVLDGVAPLHHSGRLGKVIHASYKPAGNSLKGFENALVYLRDVWSFVENAHYENTYGRFSYYSAEEFGPVYLKPRINLRDNKSMENVAPVDEESVENVGVSEKN